MTTTTAPKIEKTKLYIGGTIFIIGVLSPLLIPLVTNSNLSVGFKTILSGLLALGIPEVFMIIAVAVMGKSGYEFLKGKFFGFLKNFAPPDQVSLTRYRIGLILFSLPILLGILQPYLALYISFFNETSLWITIGFDVIFIASFFVLGGDFWDKLSGLFKYKAKIIMEE